MLKLDADQRRALIGMGAIVLFVCGLSLAASNFEDEPSNGSTETGGEYNYPWWRFAATWETVGTWAIAVYAIRQYSESSRGAHRQLRAYVGIVESSIVEFAENKAPTAHITFRNDGQTPAYDFYSSIGVCTGPYPLPEGVEIPSPLIKLTDGKINISPIGIGILTPTHKKHMSATLGIAITPDEMGKIKAGKRAFYAYGFARYRDAFNRYWQFEYRYISGGPGSTEFLYDDKTTEKQADESAHRAFLSLSGASIDFPGEPPLVPKAV